MPRSLNNSPTVILPATGGNKTTRPKSSKSTVEMVNTALIELHSLKGTTLRAVYQYILTNFNLETITNSRKLLIKKHFLDLKEAQEVEIKTGKGLTGHFKLKDKKKFINKIKKGEIQRKEQRREETAERNALKKSAAADATVKKSTKTTTKKAAAASTSKNNTKVTGASTSKNNTKVTAASTSKDNTKVKKVVKRKIQKPKVPANQPTPVVPMQTTPERNGHVHVVNGSMFDTPNIFPSQVQASTPFVESQLTFAPGVKANTKRKRALHPVNNGPSDTPRSSLQGKKRKLQKPNE